MSAARRSFIKKAAYAGHLSGARLCLLWHTLGISDPFHPNREPYRNHYVTGEGGSDWDNLMALVRSGHMARYRHALTSEVDWVFVATDLGLQTALATRPRVSRRKLRYHNFLCIKECCPDLTFHEFLTDRRYEQYW